jgi:ParB/RepB/Spo0J family partition protein
MKIKELDIDLLKPAIYNPRKIKPEQLEDLVRSIKQFGFVDPVVVRLNDNMIIGGHQRYEAAKILKYKTVPVVQLDISDNDAKVLNLALNKISGDWDKPKLSELIKELNLDINIDATLSGFNNEEIDKLLNDLALRDGIEAEDQTDLLSSEYQVVITCKNEEEQLQILDKLQEEGYNCRPLIF